jgi:hypothetical protein
LPPVDENETSGNFRNNANSSDKEAKRKARRANIAAQLPTAERLLAEGEISSEHLDALGKALDESSVDEVEASGLIQLAVKLPADLLEKRVREWIKTRTSRKQAAERQKQRRKARRGLVFDGDNDMTVLHAEFDPVIGARVRSTLETECNRRYHASGGRDTANDPNRLTPEQRMADVIADLILGNSADAESETSSRARPPVRTQMLVTATVNQHGGLDTSLLNGTPLPDEIRDQIACEAELTGIVFNQDGAVIWAGQSTRLATDAQWRALIARDGGCIACDAAPSRCEAHHVEPWRPPAGPSDIDNLALVCHRHHKQIHESGWKLLPDGSGGQRWRLAPP